MGYNLRILLHLGGILAMMMLLTVVVLNTNYYATMLVLFLILLLQIAGLLKHIHSTNREMTRFLEAVKYADFSQSFNLRKGNRSFSDLGQAFNEVLERFRRARSSKEQQAQYLQALVQHLPVAIVAIDEAEKIILSNTALNRLLNRTTSPGTLQAIQEFNAELAETIRQLKPGKERTLNLRKGNDSQSVKLSCTVLRIQGEQQKLVSIQNIESELEVRELEAWQNLIRVMTHEIMNSVTPITSLAETAGHFVDESRTYVEISDGATDKDVLLPLLEDAASAVNTIGKRGQGLMRFVTSYRTLSRLPRPSPEQVELAGAFQSMEALLGEQISRGGISFVTRCKPVNLTLYIDPEQLEQALINLLRNAIEALGEASAPEVTLSGALEDGAIVSITVADNGSGISKENLENIFVPFFTTKRGGSGIGMSMVKQIVRANGGRIVIHSEPGQGTTIRMTFRQY